MIAKTKQQKEVLALSKKLKPISKRKIKKMLPYLFINYAHNYYRNMRCNECGHIWKPKGEKKNEIKCPHCKREINYINYYFKFITFSNFIIFYTFTEKYQIMRIYNITKTISRKEKAKYYIENISNTFLDIQNGKMKVVSKILFQNWNGRISSSGNMEIRRNNYSGLFFYENHQLIEGSEIHPRIYKLGYNSFITNYLHEMKFWQQLIKNRKIETLLKHREHDLLNIFVRMAESKQDQLFKIWKIHNRNNYHVDWDIFIDYINMMERFTKFSVSNRKQIMPKDYKAAHNLVNHLLNQKRERQFNKETIKQEKERQEKEAFKKLFFKKKMYSFETFEIVSDDIKIVPLITEKDYEIEGEELHHCVYVNNYHLKNDSMCFSGIVNGKKMETIETDLNGEVLQCRGYDNEYTPYHEKLKELIKNNKHLFKNATKRRESYRELQSSNSAVS